MENVLMSILRASGIINIMNQEVLENIKQLYNNFIKKTYLIKDRLLKIKKDIIKRKEEMQINEIKDKIDQL